jgi:hypothetical protein
MSRRVSKKKVVPERKAEAVSKLIDNALASRETRSEPSWIRREKTNMAKQAVLVTTLHRGVFFGYVSGPVQENKSITIKDARNCIYWSADVKGFLGLASSGPTSGCRIGPKVPSLNLLDVTSVCEVVPEAAEKWEKHPWSL